MTDFEQQNSDNPWRPSSFKELLDTINFKIDEQSLVCRFFWFIGLPIIVGFHLPLVFIQLVNFLYRPGVTNFIGVVLALLIHGLLKLVAEGLHSLYTVKEIYQYLAEDIGDNFSLTEYSFEDYISPEEIAQMKTSRVLSTFSDQPLGNIFVLNPRVVGLEAGERKGFVAPLTFSSISRNQRKGSQPYNPCSVVFLRDPPGKLTTSGLFYLYHEVGHMTKYSWGIRRRSFVATANAFGIFIFLLIISSNIFWSTLPALPYIIYLVAIESDQKLNERDDELVADLFAIKHFPKDLLEKLNKLFSIPGVLPEWRYKYFSKLIEAQQLGGQLLEDDVVFKSGTLRLIITFFLILTCFSIKRLSPFLLIEMLLGSGLLLVTGILILFGLELLPVLLNELIVSKLAAKTD
ncbi:hypothetical protein [Nostoc sp. NMS9]|uniref:hypothetical protein n=1 Tax=Nostoc sp. NMS9 TaxID=2815393 RepID=UPI0025CE3B0C|nr:hypothetical protein [Nostoc sp. NMS9]MBN3943182.1 hypothetical protein [Nostoc sp. NMS9]